MKICDSDCCFSELKLLRKPAGPADLRICTSCLEEFTALFDSNNAIVLQLTCSFCRPILPLPGTASIRVVSANGLSICRKCCDTYLENRKSGITAKILQFPSTQN
jgi:hypothetical protein